MRSELLSDSVLADAPTIEGFKVLEPVVLYEKLGEGGMGAVYRGHHLKLDIPVALKCLKPVIAEENPELVARFKREATVAASLDSENLVRVFDVLRSGALHYLLMEFVPGETIRQRVERLGPLEPDLAASAVYEAARGLVPAHEKGIVHRDIKPDNIIIADSGRIKVTDLGLAKVAQGGESFRTRSGVIMGTPSYMPPEQYRDASDLGPPADVYSLALTLYFALTGKSAVEGGSVVQVMRRVCEEPLPDLEAELPDLPAGLANVFRMATAKEPEDRPRNAMEFMSLIGPYRRRRGARAGLAAKDRRDEDAAATRRAVLEATVDQRGTIRERMRAGRDAAPSGSVASPTVPPTLAAPEETEVASVPPTAVATAGRGDATAAPSPAGTSRSKLIVGGALLGVLLFGLIGFLMKSGSLGGPSSSERDRFERGVADLRGAKTLDRGVDTLLALRADAPDYPGLADELRPALVVLARRHLDEEGLGRSWTLAREARALGADDSLGSLEEELRTKISARLAAAVRVEAPEVGTELRVARSPIEVRGRVDVDRLRDVGLDELSLRLGDRPVRLVGGGFRVEAELKEGRQLLPLRLRAFDAVGAGPDFAVVLDRTPPRLALDPRAEGDFVREPVVELTGTVVDDSPTRVRVEIPGQRDRQHQARVRSVDENEPATWRVRVPLSDGRHTLRVVAVDEHGGTSAVTTEVAVDTADPVIRLDSRPEFVETPRFDLRGTLVESNPGTFVRRGPSGEIDDEAGAGEPVVIEVGEKGAFRTRLDLGPGDNYFFFRAKDAAGREALRRVKLRRETAGTWSEKAAAALVTGRIEEADKLLAAARKLSATSPAVRRLDYQLAFCRGDIEAASQDLRASAALAGEDSILVNDRAVGRWLAEMRSAKPGAYPTSRRLRADFERAVGLDAKNLAARANLGLMMVLTGDAEAGEKLCREAVDARPNDPALRHALGWVQQRRGRPLEAVVHYDRAVRVDAGHISTRLNRGEAHGALRNAQRSSRDLVLALGELAKRAQSPRRYLHPPVKLGARAGGRSALVITPAVAPTRTLAAIRGEAAIARHRAGDHVGAVRDWDAAGGLEKPAAIGRIEALVAGLSGAGMDRAISLTGSLLSRSDLTRDERARLKALRAAAGLEAVFRRPGSTSAKDAPTRLDRALGDVNHVGILMARSLARLRAKDWRGAEADLTAILKREPDNARAYYLRSTARSWLGNWAGYEGDARAAYARNPRVAPDAAERLGGWRVAMRKMSPKGQSYIQPKTWPPAKDPQDTANTRQGKAVSFIGKGTRNWLVVHETPGVPFQQRIHRSKTFPANWVKKNWEERFQIRAVTWTGSEVVVVMRKTKATDTWIQTYSIVTKSPDAWIKEKAEKESFRLTMIGRVSATQMVYIMDRPTNSRLTPQTWWTSPEIPSGFFGRRAGEGFRPQAMSYDGTAWRTAMTKFNGEAIHRFHGGAIFPRDAVKKSWSQGYRIVAAAWGPDVPALLPVSGSAYEYFDAGKFREAERALQAQISQEAKNQMPYLLMRRRLIDLQRGVALAEVQRRALLDRAWSAPQQDTWSRQLLGFFAGDIDEAGILALAGSDKEHLCEAAYYAARFRLARGDRAGYRQLLRKCVDQKVTTFTEYNSARNELGRK